MEPEKEAAQCYEQMHVVEKYETVVAYLYPIAQNLPRKHGTAMRPTPIPATCSTIWRLTMASAVINTRKDLDALAGTPEHAAFMAMLSGSLWRLVRDDVAKAWLAVEDNTTISRFGFMRADFPTAQPPALPAYWPFTTVTEAQAAAITGYKGEACRRIIDRWPDYKQRNMTARGLELTRKRVAGATLTADETAEEAAIQAAWDWIKQVRTAENIATAAALAATTFEGVAAVVPGWPT